MKRLMLTLCCAAVAALPIVAQQKDDPDKNVAGAGTLPSGWQARLDNPGANLSSLKFVAAGGGFHATTGPAAIFFKPATVEHGPFQASATFTQTKPAAHPEAYGIIIGGADLSGPAQKYTYFLVRQDGKFLIKRRDGDQTKNVKEWTENAAIKKADDTGKTTNTLTVDAGKTDVRFLVNDAEVASLPASGIDTQGIVGLRVNHNLDVEIIGFSVKH